MRARAARVTTIVAVSASELEGVDLGDFYAPGVGHGILDVFRRRYLLRLLVRKATRTRYRGSVLGWGWSYLKSAFLFGVYYVVFGAFLGLHKNVDNFAVYLYSGIVLVQFFTEGIRNATRAVEENAPLVRKVYLPRELFPVASIIVALTHFLPQAVVLLVIVLCMGWVPTVSGVLAILLSLVLVGGFALGIGLFFGAINVYFRDARNFVELIEMIATWTAPVLYTWTQVSDSVPEWVFRIYMSSPLAAGVSLFHHGFWAPISDGTVVSSPHLWGYAGSAAVVMLIVLAIGQAVFRKLDRGFAQEL